MANENKKESRVWYAVRLFLTMLKIGAFTFGGGYAMIAILENEFVSKKQWIDKDEFMDMVALAESTPGPIAINSATYLGYKKAGIIGSAMATSGVVLPSFVIIYLISLFFERFMGLEYVGYAFAGIKVAVIYLIGAAGIKLLKGMKKNTMTVTLISLTVVALVVLSLLAVRFSTILYILVGGVVGTCVYLIHIIRKKEVTK
ncbi:MAG: chromate transporter [Clostridia bacterium]|nr:chromate transporter [Clostridia bacterium]